MNNEWIVQNVRAKFQQATLKDVIDTTIEPLDALGINYTSTLLKIRITFTLENGTKKKVTLISKANYPAEGTDMSDFFNNRAESGIYLNALSQMEKLMMEFEDRREIFWPTLFGHIPYSVLLLEDLGAKRYDVKPQHIWLDSEHALLCLRTLGRFHAMSKILLKQGLVGEEYKNKYLLARKGAFHDKCITGSAYMLSKSMMAKEGHWKYVQSSETWANLLQKLLPSIGDRYEETYMNYDDRFRVLNHGDFRCSNMLFRSMEYTGRPVDVKFIDFQLAHVNSFSWDVIYFLSVSVDPVYRRTHRKELLEAYQQSLADNLEFFHWEGYVPTVDDVIKEVERLSFVQFIYMCSLTPFLTTKVDGAMVLDKMITHPPEEVYNKLIYSEESLVNGLIGDFERMIELKVI